MGCELKGIDEGLIDFPHERDWPRRLPLLEAGRGAHRVVARCRYGLRGPGAAVTDETKAAERIAFDRAVDAYDRVRPTYPPPLFDEMFRYLRDRDGIATAEPQVMEIGPGTGKATRDRYSSAACDVTAVEIGAGDVGVPATQVRRRSA